MTEPVKTPVSALQEFLVKNGGILPQYELVYSGCGSTKVWFKFQLSIAKFTVFGEGSSKKEAKHNTAKAMLIKLGEWKETEPRAAVASPPTEEIKSLTIAPPCTFNAIGSLNEHCARFHLPTAQYSVVKEEGPPHKKEFTLKCNVGNESEVAFANTKQEAKHQCAAKMLKKLNALSQNQIDSLQEEGAPTSRLTEEELRGIIKKFKASSSLMKLKNLPSNNSPLPFKEYHNIVKLSPKVDSSVMNILANIVRQKDFASFEAQLEVNYDYFLTKLLQDLNLNHDYIVIPPHIKSGCAIISLNIDYTIPISFLGVGTVSAAAKKMAAIEAINWLVRLHV